MGDKAAGPIEINLFDLFCVVLKKSVMILIVSLALSICFFVYGYRASVSNVNGSEISRILDIDNRLPDERDDAYSNRVMKVNRARGLMTSIDVANFQVSTLENYINSSYLMRIDPNNTAHSTAQVAISLDGENQNGMCEAICSAYKYDLLYEDYIETVAQEVDCSPEYIRELICIDDYSESRSEVSSSIDELSIYGTGEHARVINIVVISDSIELSDLILDALLDEMSSKYDVIYSGVGEHSVDLVGRQSYISYDSFVSESQRDVVTTLNTLQNQLNNYYNSLDALANHLGLADRNSFYEYGDSGSSGVRNCVLYSVIGFLLGAVISISFYIVKYIWGDRLLSQSQFFSYHKNINKIGVCNPLVKKSKINSLLDTLTEDDSGLSLDKTNEIVIANYKNLVSNDKALLVGTANPSEVQNIIRTVGIADAVVFNVFEDPSVLRMAADYDGFVLVEQRGKSSKKAIRKEIELLSNTGKKIIGAIII